jgi:hypothetical protein
MELAPKFGQYFRVIKELLMEACLGCKDLHFRQPLTSGFSDSLVVSKHYVKEKVTCCAKLFQWMSYAPKNSFVTGEK